MHPWPNHALNRTVARGRVSPPVGAAGWLTRQATQMKPFSLLPISTMQLEYIAASLEPIDLQYTAEPGALPPSFVAAKTLELAEELASAAWARTFLIVRHADSKLIGACGFKALPVDGRVEVGYGVAPIARGQGAATAALGLLAQVAFGAGATEVLAEVLPSNASSIRVVQKSGFTNVGSRLDTDNEPVQQWLLAASVA